MGSLAGEWSCSKYEQTWLHFMSCSVHSYLQQLGEAKKQENMFFPSIFFHSADP